MPPERRDPTKAADWLRRARSNLARAKALADLPDMIYEDACFDAQQAAEKAIKAILVHTQVPFPKTHSISALLQLCADCGIVVQPHLLEATILTDYAVEARYPGLLEDVTEEEYDRAINLADRLFSWAEALVLADSFSKEETTAGPKTTDELKNEKQNGSQTPDQ